MNLEVDSKDEVMLHSLLL